jgi:hypothetical protein
MAENIQGTYYLTKEEHREFKIRCITDGVSMTEKIKDLIKEHLNKTDKK